MAADASGGRVGIIVLDTIVDGVDPHIPLDVLRNPFELSACRTARMIRR